MERFGASFLIAGVVTFLLGFFLQGLMPVITLSRVPVGRMEEMTTPVFPDFVQLAEDYPQAFASHFGKPTSESLARALRLGKSVYVAEACWHCHSQFVRPVSNENLRYGPVSTPAEYQNELNFPHLFGTRRVGPDLIRESGKHSNDWHAAHFYDPRSVSPYSVMPSYPWLFDETRQPNERGLALIAYVQWLGSWIEEIPLTIYNTGAFRTGEERTP